MTLAHHLVVFARTPRLGRVKTRLGRDIGAGAALAFYRLTLSSVLRRLGGNGGSDRGGGRRWRCWLAITPDTDIHLRRPWPAGWRMNAESICPPSTAPAQEGESPKPIYLNTALWPRLPMGS